MIHITRHDYSNIVITDNRITSSNNGNPKIPNQYIRNENKILLTPTNIKKVYTKAEYAKQSIEIDVTPELKKYIDKFLEIRNIYRIDKYKEGDVEYLTKKFTQTNFTNLLQKYTFCLEEPLTLQRIRRSYATYNRERRDLNLISESVYQESVEKMRHTEDTQRDNYEHKNYQRKIYIPCPKRLERSYQDYHKDLDKRFQYAKKQLRRTKKNDKMTQHDQASDDDITVNTHLDKKNNTLEISGISCASKSTNEYNKDLRSRYVYTFIGDEDDNNITSFKGIGRIKKNKNAETRNKFPYRVIYLNDENSSIYECLPESEYEPLIIQNKNEFITVKLLPRGYVPFNVYLLDLKVDLKFNSDSTLHKGIIMKNEDIQTMIEKPYVIKYMDTNTSEINSIETHIPFIFPEDYDNDTFNILHIRLNEDNLNNENYKIYEKITQND